GSCELMSFLSCCVRRREVADSMWPLRARGSSLAGQSDAGGMQPQMIICRTNGGHTDGDGGEKPMSGPLKSEEALRTVYPDPGQTRGKVLPALEKHAKTYIGLSPFLCIGTSRPDGL